MNIAHMVSTHDKASLEPSAFKDASSHLRLWVLTTAGLAVDLWSKQWAFTRLDVKEVHSVWEGVLEFRRSLNPGAVFGLGTGLVSVFIIASMLALGFVLFLFHSSSHRQRLLHGALGMILAGALGNLHDRAFIQADVVTVRDASGATQQFIGALRSDAPSDKILLGDWPGGDHPLELPRDHVTSVRRQGVVRDFIKIMPRFPEAVPWLGGRDVWPWVFNLADALLVCGVILLMIHFRLAPPAASTDSEASKESSEPSLLSKSSTDEVTGSSTRSPP